MSACGETAGLWPRRPRLRVHRPPYLSAHTLASESDWRTGRSRGTTRPLQTYFDLAGREALGGRSNAAGRGTSRPYVLLSSAPPRSASPVIYPSYSRMFATLNPRPTSINHSRIRIPPPPPPPLCAQADVFEEIATMDFPFEGIPTIPPRKDMEHFAFFCDGCRYR